LINAKDLSIDSIEAVANRLTEVLSRMFYLGKQVYGTYREDETMVTRNVTIENYQDVCRALEGLIPLLEGAPDVQQRIIDDTALALSNALSQDQHYVNHCDEILVVMNGFLDKYIVSEDAVSKIINTASKIIGILEGRAVREPVVRHIYARDIESINQLIARLQNGEMGQNPLVLEPATREGDLIALISSLKSSNIPVDINSQILEEMQNLIDESGPEVQQGIIDDIALGLAETILYLYQNNIEHRGDILCIMEDVLYKYNVSQDAAEKITPQLLEVNRSLQPFNRSAEILDRLIARLQ